VSLYIEPPCALSCDTGNGRCKRDIPVAGRDVATIPQCGTIKAKLCRQSAEAHEVGEVGTYLMQRSMLGVLVGGGYARCAAACLVSGSVCARVEGLFDIPCAGKRVAKSSARPKTEKTS
jgi:hypothetical protein